VDGPDVAMAEATIGLIPVVINKRNTQQAILIRNRTRKWPIKVNSKSSMNMPVWTMEEPMVAAVVEDERVELVDVHIESNISIVDFAYSHVFLHSAKYCSSTELNLSLRMSIIFLAINLCL
jgi:hypothetical protein